MANTVIALKKSGTPSAIPVDLANGEIAINYADGKIFYKSAAGSIQEISGGGGGGNAFGTVNANGTLVVADTPGDVLTLIPGNGITIVGDAITDSIIISSVADVSFPYNTANAAFDKANTAETTAVASYDQSNTNSTIITASFGKANDAYTIAVAAFDTANNSGIGIAAYDQANIATQIAIASFDKVNAVAIGANSYADTVGAGANAWVSANFTTLAAGAAAYDYANSVGTISINAFDKANSANVLAYNTGIGANAFTSATIAGANTAVGTGANTYAAAVGVAANNFASATIAGANSAVGSGANAYADIVGTSANSYLLTVIAGANAAVGAGANTVGSAAFDKANTAETIAIAAYANSNTKLSTSGGTITGDLAVVGNLAISGNTSYISVQNYRVDDPLVYLAGNNYISDIVDIGFIGNYVNSTGSNVHTGLFRNHEDKEYYLFYGYDQEPENNHIDPNGNNFTLAVLNTDIRTSNLVLGGQNAITWITSAYDKANAANVLAYDTGVGANAYASTVGTSANAFTSATVAGANTAVGAGANAFTSATIAGANTAVGAGANAFTSATIAGANTAVGAGANAYANVVWSRSNAFTSATVAGANTAVGAGANAFTSATVAGANTISIAAFNKANAALANTTGTFQGTLTLTGDFVSNSRIGLSNITSSRDRIRLYNNDPTFAIGMQSGITFGGLNDWGMTFQFSTETARGFWWGHTTHTVAQGAMALTTDGRLTVAKSLRIGFGESDATDPGTNYTIEIGGSLAAQTKSFLINHPTIPGKKLRYGSLEGPENGVYVRGKLINENVIELPEYWTKLIDPDSITVTLTPIGKHHKLYVEKIENNKVYIKSGNIRNKNFECFYIVFGERIDVEKLKVEVD